jgi:hypothetical protein
MEILKGDDVTNGGVAARGRFTIAGAITDKGKVTDYRTVNGARGADPPCRRRAQKAPSPS